MKIKIQRGRREGTNGATEKKEEGKSKEASPKAKISKIVWLVDFP